MRKNKLIIVPIIFVSFTTLGYLLLKPVSNYLEDYLSKSVKVKANILIVEGWLPEYAIEMAYEEFRKNEYEQIITTGLNSFNPYLNVFSNGYLIFYPGNRLSELSDNSPHSIEVDAFSELDGDNRAHFNIFINDSLIADFFADKQKKKYRINWQGSLNLIDSILIQFDNDNLDEFGDRNLFVKEIVVDHKIAIHYLNNSEYDISKLDGQQRLINNSVSNAQNAKNHLTILGIDSSQITAVSGRRVKINRTLRSALAFRDWLKTKDIDIKGINIISLGPHARRTWLTYNKILNEKYDIGIIALPQDQNKYSVKRKTLKTLRETLGIIYYWFILIPY